MLLILTDWKTDESKLEKDGKKGTQVLVNADTISHAAPAGNSPPATRIYFLPSLNKPHLDVMETPEAIFGQQATLAGVVL